MNRFAIVFLLFFSTTACVQPKAEDSYDKGLKELQLKADALQAVADLANKKAKDAPTPENKAAAEAANIAVAEAVMDAAIYTVPRAIDAHSSESKNTSGLQKRGDKFIPPENLSTEVQYTSIVVLTNELFLVGEVAADMSTSIKNLGPKNRQIDISICGFHVDIETIIKLEEELDASGYDRIAFVSDGAYLIKEVCANYAIKGTSE